MIDARSFFAARLAFQTDVSDVHAALDGAAPFVLVDARSRLAFAQGHIPGARNVPHATSRAPTSTRTCRW